MDLDGLAELWVLRAINNVARIVANWDNFLT